MTTYVATADNSNITPSWANTSVFDKDMIEGATGGGNFTVTIPASSTRSASWITVVGKPNNDDWSPDGTTQTVEIDLNMGDSDVTGDCRIVRLQNDGTIVESGNFVGTQVMSAGTKTFSPVSPTWTSGACDDRIAIEFVFVESAGMNANLKFDIRITTAEIIADIPEDVGACVAVGFITPQINNSSAMI